MRSLITAHDGGDGKALVTRSLFWPWGGPSSIAICFLSEDGSGKVPLLPFVFSTSPSSAAIGLDDNDEDNDEDEDDNVDEGGNT